MKKKIVMLIVPAFVLAGCEVETETAVVNTDKQGVTTPERFYTSADINAYEKAKEAGYTGTIDEWDELVKVSDTNPEKAQEMAAAAGFSGSDLLLAGIAGAALANMMANGSYDRERDRRYSSSGAYIARTTPTYSNNASTKKYSGPSHVSQAKPTTTPSKPAIGTTSKGSFTSVSRGGFGGAVSSGG